MAVNEILSLWQNVFKSIYSFAPFKELACSLIQQTSIYVTILVYFHLCHTENVQNSLDF